MSIWGCWFAEAERLRAIRAEERCQAQVGQEMVELQKSRDLGHDYTMWGTRSISKLVNITPITMVYGTYNYSYWGL